VSPAKAAINSDRAIAEKLTGAWLPYQKSSALQWPAQSNCRLKAEDVLKFQNHDRGRRGAPLPYGSDVIRLATRRRCSSRISSAMLVRESRHQLGEMAHSVGQADTTSPRRQRR
jgi:hypothetical protein